MSDPTNDRDKGLRSAEALEAIARLRDVCGALTHVSEAVDGFGHTSFRVRDKPFVIMGEGEGVASLAMKVGPETQARLIARGDFTIEIAEELSAGTVDDDDAARGLGLLPRTDDADHLHV